MSYDAGMKDDIEPPPKPILNRTQEEVRKMTTDQIMEAMRQLLAEIARRAKGDK
jgi:hypothetical protein